MPLANTNKSSGGGRNYGIDLLRLVSMFYVLLLHCLGQGGLLKNTISYSPQYKLVYFIEICAYCAVNVFALISGYVSVRDRETKVKVSSFINLWSQAVFYGVLFFVIFRITNPVVAPKNLLIRAFTPITCKSYWYLNAYAGLFVLMPLLNKAIEAADKALLKKMFVAIFITFSLYDVAGQVFKLHNGYSFIWIVLMYIMGAAIKKCDIGRNLKTRQILLGILLVYLVTFSYLLYGKEFEHLTVVVTKGIFMNYISPTIVIASILHVILFSRMKFSQKTINIIKFAAPSAFAVYMINNNIFIWDQVMDGLFLPYTNSSLVKIFSVVFGFSIAFLVGSILLDKMRDLLYKIFRIDKLVVRLGQAIEHGFNKAGSLL